MEWRLQQLLSATLHIITIPTLMNNPMKPQVRIIIRPSDTFECSSDLRLCRHSRHTTHMSPRGSRYTTDRSTSYLLPLPFRVVLVVPGLIRGHQSGKLNPLPTHIICEVKHKSGKFRSFRNFVSSSVGSFEFF